MSSYQTPREVKYEMAKTKVYALQKSTTAKNEDKKTSGRTGEALDIGVKT